MKLFSRLIGGLRDFKQRRLRKKRVLPDGGKLVYRDVDLCIIEEVYENGAYGDVREIPEGGVVVDCGGHIGVFALWAAKRVGPSGRVLVFEPADENLALLRKNIAANGLRQAKVFDCALAERDGSDLLYLAPAQGNPAANTLKGDAGQASVPVRLRRLDGVLAEEKVSRIDLLKIDVEGAELALMAGARNALALARRVVMEAHPQKIDPEQAVSLLKATGLTVTVRSKKPYSWLIEARRA